MTAQINFSLTVELSRDGDWYVARPVKPEIVTGVSSKISFADAVANLEKHLAAQPLIHA